MCSGKEVKMRRRRTRPLQNQSSQDFGVRNMTCARWMLGYLLLEIEKKNKIGWNAFVIDSLWIEPSPSSDRIHTSTAENKLNSSHRSWEGEFDLERTAKGRPDTKGFHSQTFLLWATSSLFTLTYNHGVFYSCSLLDIQRRNGSKEVVYKNREKRNFPQANSVWSWV